MTINPLVCIFAHPDDEAFGPGGSIAKLTQERPVYEICITNGDAGKYLPNQDVNHLAEIRRQELLESASILGIQETVFLNYKDGSLSNNFYSQLVNDISGILNHYHPDSIMTYDLLGISGHIDHIVTAMVATYVFYKLDYLKNLFYFIELESNIVENRANYFIYMPPGYNLEQADMVIDIADVWATKVASMKAHVSQSEDANRLLKRFETKPKRELFKVIKK